MLIPVVVPDRLRFRVLHNHLEVALSAALRTRTDVIVARVPVAVRATDAAPSPDDDPGHLPSARGGPAPS